MVLVLTSLLGVVGLTYIGAIIAFLLPRKDEGSKPADIGKLSATGVMGSSITSDIGNFHSGVAGPFTYDATGRGDAQGVFLVQMGAAGSTNPKDYIVLEQTCRHLGCPVAWTPGGTNGGSFNCPCHGSVYHKDGQVAVGPANAPLYKHDFTITGGELVVKGRILS